MGLNHPADLAAWQRWQGRQHPVRALRSRVRRSAPTGVLSVGGSAPDVLVVLDSTSPSNRAALLAPVLALPPEHVAVLSPTAFDLGPAWTSVPWSGGHLPPVGSVLSAGHYLPLGAIAQAYAERTGARTYVAQHGLLTPFNPPLPAGAKALVWSEQDGDFWASGRTDVDVETVGSQLLWEAARDPVTADPEAPITYLGQLHAAELPRRALAAAAAEFCQRTGATYRPHPSERDRRSRRTHRRWEGAGMHLDRDGRPLADLRGPVVSVFSTGVLEAAARGLPAAVAYPDPPPWLEVFWERNQMSRLAETTDPFPHDLGRGTGAFRAGPGVFHRVPGEIPPPAPAERIAAILGGS